MAVIVAVPATPRVARDDRTSAAVRDPIPACCTASDCQAASGSCCRCGTGVLCQRACGQLSTGRQAAVRAANWLSWRLARHLLHRRPDRREQSRRPCPRHRSPLGGLPPLPTVTADTQAASSLIMPNTCRNRPEQQHHRPHSPRSATLARAAGGLDLIRLSQAEDHARMADMGATGNSCTRQPASA